MFRESKWIAAIFIFFLVSIFSPTAYSMEDGKAISESVDKRFAKFGNGTILDRKTSLVWMEKDYWQMEGKWVNWYTAREYAQKMNNKNYGGHQDWRVPTAEEAATLYDRRKRNIDKDGDKIFIDSMFPKGAGWGTWSSDEKRNKAIAVSFKDEGGQSYQDKISGVDAFLRLVRKAGPSAK
ncbi:MAG: DUF1566 domain-containing protein [Nitrospinae bacterium]|nr:DUF1566 domain-containing protein [Nitrospinota bacterium]